MGKARYVFVADVWYCCRVVRVREDALEFPAVGRLLTLVKVTLAVDGVFEGEQLRPSPAKEAVVYADPSDQDEAEFLRGVGVIKLETSHTLAADRPSLRCRFAPAGGATGFQPLRDYSVLASAPASVEPPEPRSHLGLEFYPEGVRRGSARVKLAAIPTNCSVSLTVTLGTVSHRPRTASFAG